ncbi:uncharacterized protein G2W53_012001 [Senna tora]|uniref:Uncharacterized protein n=1 Tax=Senna tora TaxID=362788 RepID=A0A834WQD6_9FABA|nr:uncharacterized protein G2W53_012001 [Senna tora]
MEGSGRLARLLQLDAIARKKNPNGANDKDMNST